MSTLADVLDRQAPEGIDNLVSRLNGYNYYITTEFKPYASVDYQANQFAALISALAEQTKAINDHTEVMAALVEQNQMLIQAMAGEEGVEEVDRYQTL